MQSSLEKLRKLFRLEHGNGYSNTAVIGGLANILNFWEGEARNNQIPEELIQAVGATLRAYGDQTPAERIEALKALWRKVQERYPEAIPEKKPARPEPARAPAAAALQVKPPQPVMPAQLPPEPATAPVEAPVQTIPPQAEVQAQVPPEPATPPIEEPGQKITAQPEILEQAPVQEAPKDLPETPPEMPAEKPAAAPATPATKPAPPAHPQARPVPGRADSRPGGVTSKRPIALNASLTVLAGVGPRHASMLTRLGLQHPRGYALQLPAPL